MDLASFIYSQFFYIDIFEDDYLKKLEEREIGICFIIDQSPNSGDSLDCNIDEENRTTKYLLILVLLGCKWLTFFIKTYNHEDT
ncbi:unnamed protein product [Lactuca virosa]|uniref:Uncharacterized protein n=1 Tax=Lactuca virosa TaxID=75947 RepID=A0AAU9P6T3_9ASTR|nr:unnamed protein product [Lactuca virosa]